MSQHGQTHFSVFEHFGTLCIKGLRAGVPFYTNKKSAASQELDDLFHPNQCVS